MKFTTRTNRIALAVALSLGLSTTALANTGQSSAISGKVTGPQGNPAATSTVTIVHTPTGTTKEITVGADGSFSARGLKIGGPYTIYVQSKKFQGQVSEGIYLDLNKTHRFNAQLKVPTDVERIVVTGSKNIFSNSGSSSVFGEDQLTKGNTFNRDLKDVVRLNPLAVVDSSGDDTSLSIAGSNPKYNALTVDGVALNDTFGLNTTGYPSQRSPVSLDTVEQISIDYSPFNGRAADFSGGLVNVVTKSGTNEFKGGAFYEWIADSGTAKDDRVELRQDPDVPNQSIPIDKEEESVGVHVGGPILKDKVFFFASYEEWTKDISLNYDLNTLSNHNLSPEELNQTLNILQDVYGLTDSLNTSAPQDTDKKYLAKFDWNINSDHRADVTFSYQDNVESRNYTDERDTLNLNSNAWTQESKTTFVSSHLYSDWSSDFSTELSFSYKKYKQDSVTNSDWGQISVRVQDVREGREVIDPGGTFTLGRDQNRHANVLENENYTLALHANYYHDDINYSFGINIEDEWNYNLYGRHSAGTWSFESLEDFENKAPNRFDYSNAYTNNVEDLAYDVDSRTYALYGQAETELFEDFIITGSLRYELLTVDGSPTLNELFLSEYGYANTENLDGLDILLPRIGFEWDAMDNVKVRGGVGRFSGGMPLVWVANAYTRDGVTSVTAPRSATSAVTSNPDLVDFTSIPQVAQDSLIQGQGSTNNIAPDFEMPSEIRYQLAADVTFDIPYIGEDFLWTTEFNYADRKDSPYWYDMARVDNGNRAVDGRIIWDSRYEGDQDDLYNIELRNVSDGGHSRIITTALEKSWDNGLTITSSYTNQDIEEVNPGTSSTAESNYQYEVNINRNHPLMGKAYYEIEHRFNLNIAYEHEFVAGYPTSFNLFFERRSGRPVSWTLGAHNDDDLGDQSRFNRADSYLVYLPSGPNDPAFDFGARLSYEEIMERAAEAGVDGYAGGYIPRGATNQPWLTTLDLTITQELPGFAEDHNSMIYVNIDNFANMLNDDWGKSYRMEHPQQILYDYDVNEEGQYVLSTPWGGGLTSNFNQFRAEESTWSIKVGLRYNF